MFKRCIPLAVFVLLTYPCFCQVLFEKDFSEVLPDDPSKAQVRTGSLDFKFHQETGDHLWIKDYYGQGVHYHLDPSITDPAAHPTLYLSFVLRSLNESTQGKFAGVILYKGGQEVFGAGNDNGSENFSFWNAQGMTASIGEIPTAVNDGEIHKIVIRIDFNPAGPEHIKVGLDPFCRRSEDRQPDHIWTTYDYELSFDEIRIRCGNADCAWEFDEIRIGTDWESVTPSDNNPGEYINRLTANPMQIDKEMILDGVARFWPTGVNPNASPSLALESPRQSIGPVSESWQLIPQLGSAEGKKYAYFNIPAQVDLYGTGEVTGSLLRNGYKIRLFNKDNGAYGEPDRLYQSHPWVLGIRPDGTAFGVIFDTTWRAELNLRAGILFTVSAESPAFPVIVIEGQNPQDVMTKLADLTGRMPMPPRWALGYQQCRFSYIPDARAREIADTFRAKRIPCDVIWFDIDYMDGFRIFTFSPTQYPDPKATNDYLHSLGFKGVWMIDPGVKHEPGYSVYDSGTQIDAWVKDISGNAFVGPVWPGNCVFPDFTIPAVRSWWSSLYQNFMLKGIDGVWNDMDEPTVFGLPELTMPKDNQFRGGGGLPPGPHEQYHNAYGMLMVKASREGIQSANPDKRPFVLTRSNFLGGHRYAATWTGDNSANWQHLKWSIPMSLNLSLSGQPFSGADIGGFLDNATPELWGNWIAVGAFYPFSRAHTCAGTANQEPWEFGQEVENASRTALQRRYRLMPYLYTVFRQAHQQGLPVMGPVFFADPADLSLRMEDGAFMLGQNLIVVPKWAENVRLPQGIWQKVSLVGEDSTADTYQCDVLVRGGAVVPLGPVVETTQQIGTLQQLTLLIVLDENGQADGVVYEDAGDGYDYNEGDYCLSTFTAQRSGNGVIVKCADQQGNLKTQSRIVNIMVVDGNKVYRGEGDVCNSSGITVLTSALVTSYTASDSPGSSPNGNGSTVNVWTVTGDGGASRSYLKGSQDGNANVWTIWDMDGGAGTYATHAFEGGALKAGQSVSIDWTHNTSIDPGTSIGIRLLDGSDSQVEFVFRGGRLVYSKYDTATGVYADSAKYYDRYDFFQVAFTLTGANTYAMSVTEGSIADNPTGSGSNTEDGNPAAGDVVDLWTGSFTGSAITAIQIFTEGGNGSDQWFDNLTIRENPVELTMPHILSGPDCQIVPAGSTAVFSVVVSSDSPATYRWYKVVNGTSDTMLADGGDISGAAAGTLSIANADIADEGLYYCIVSNDSEIPVTSGQTPLGIKRKIAYWPFEGHDMNSTVVGSPASVAVGTPTFVSQGMTGDAIEFQDGVDFLYTDPALSSYFDVCNYQMTAACWVKTTDNQTWCPLVARNGEDGQGWQLRQHGFTANRPCFTTRGTGNDEGTPASRTIYDGRWHYVAATFDGTVKKVYIDGIVSRSYFADDGSMVSESDEVANPITNTSCPVSIGSRVRINGVGGLTVETSNVVAGVYDEVEIYNYALDAAAIAQTYANLTGTDVCVAPQNYDLDNDCCVDINDLVLLASEWLNSELIQPTR